jgi:hypothetical protein
VRSATVAISCGALAKHVPADTAVVAQSGLDDRSDDENPLLSARNLFVFWLIAFMDGEPSSTQGPFAAGVSVLARLQSCERCKG